MRPSLRATLLAQLQGQRHDVLILGGGIVGAGIARDAVMRGLKVALVEQGDFASGTSSKTSKLIHGGLRYLERGRLRLVFESLRERQILRQIAPATVRPITLTLPTYAQDARGLWRVRAGLMLYDVLAGRKRVRSHRMMSAGRAVALEPNLRVEGLRGAGLFGDCQMDDARLCLANVLQAHNLGAVCANYVRVLSLLKAGGRVCGAQVEDALGGRAFEVEATVVINATGPWADGVRGMSDLRAPRRLAPTKGIHLIIPRVAQEGLFVQVRAAGRMMFILPWGDYSLVGTTETRVDQSLDALQASRAEVAYLLEEVHRVLPGSRVGETDVITTFAGARPLLAFEGSATQASREHRIEVDRWGLVTILGGKYTTYRLMAQQVVDLVIRQQRWTAETCLTDQVSLFENPQPVALEQWRRVSASMDPDLFQRLLLRYGAGIFRILQRIDDDPSLARPVCPHHEYIAAELVHGFEDEMACTITDVLARRTRIAWSSCQGLDALSMVTELSARYDQASSTQLAEQIYAYQRFLSDGLGFRPDLAAQRGDGTADTTSASL